MLVAKLPAAMTAARSAANESPQPLREARLWIDGVGCWLLWLPDEFAIGGPQRRGSSLAPAADLPLFADLRSRHALLARRGEGYELTALAAAAVNGHPVTDVTTCLRSGDEFTLGQDVGFEFTIPTPLSNTARLVCTSGHRPEERLDGIILLEQVCQLGPQPDHHIHCPAAESPLILFRKGTSLWCRSPQEWTLNGRPVTGSAALQHGVVVSTETLSFRLEIPLTRQVSANGDD